jgi:hypothetical protein
MDKALAVAGFVVLVGMAGAVGAEESGLGRCSAGTAERLTFIEDRLEMRRQYATWWWRGWTTFYGLGVVIQGVRGGLEKDDSTQADLVVSAVKAGIGTTRLLVWPTRAKEGADPMRAVAPVDENGCRERLRIGEELMRVNARESEARWDWKRHAANVALNVAGGVIVAEGWDDPSRGWRSAGTGFAVGEIFVFSHPWKADEDLAEYEQRFDRTAAIPVVPVTFSLTPALGGIQFGMRF